jgi:polyferredoxin
MSGASLPAGSLPAGASGSTTTERPKHRRPSPELLRRPRRGLAALRGIQGFRRAVQVAVALAVLVVAFGSTGGSGTTTPEALCPFGGIESIWQFITTGGLVQHVHTSNVVLAGALLAVAFMARGAFCGWICPLGFIQDLVAGFGALVQRRIPPVRNAIRALHRRSGFLSIVDRPLRLLKYGVLAWAVWGTATFGLMVFRDVDPWIALLNVAGESTGFGIIVLAVTLVGSLFVDRPWCRYACPLGAANGILARFSPIRLERNKATCVDCGACTRACPVNLPVATSTQIVAADCMGCLECVEACPVKGALELRAGLPVLRPA